MRALARMRSAGARRAATSTMRADAPCAAADVRSSSSSSRIECHRPDRAARSGRRTCVKGESFQMRAADARRVYVDDLRRNRREGGRKWTLDLTTMRAHHRRLDADATEQARDRAPGSRCSVTMTLMPSMIEQGGRAHPRPTAGSHRPGVREDAIGDAHDARVRDDSTRRGGRPSCRRVERQSSRRSPPRTPARPSPGRRSRRSRHPVCAPRAVRPVRVVPSHGAPAPGLSPLVREHDRKACVARHGAASCVGNRCECRAELRRAAAMPPPRCGRAICRASGCVVRGRDEHAQPGIAHIAVGKAARDADIQDACVPRARAGDGR